MKFIATWSPFFLHPFVYFEPSKALPRTREHFFYFILFSSQCEKTNDEQSLSRRKPFLLPESDVLRPFPTYRLRRFMPIGTDSFSQLESRPWLFEGGALSIG